MEPRPQSSRLSWLAVALGAGVCALLGSIGADARWLAALGRTILEQGSIPSGVPYAAALTLLALGMRGLGASDAASAVVLMLVFLAAVPSFLIVRAQLFSLVLFCAALLLLRAESRRPSRRVWLLVPLIVLWANLHGGVLVGLATAAAYLVLERARREPVVAASVLAACCAALFLTPALLVSGHYYLGVLHSEAAQRGEGLWAPLSVGNPFDVLFVVLAIPLLIFAFRSGSRVWELACIAAFAGLTLHAGRNSVWLLCFIAAPAAHGLGKRFLRDFSVSACFRRRNSMAPASGYAVRPRGWPPASRSSRTASTPNSWRSTGGASGSRIRSMRSRVVTSACTSTGSTPTRLGMRCCAELRPSSLRAAASPSSGSNETVRSAAQAWTQGRPSTFAFPRTSDSARTDASLRRERVLLRQCDTYTAAKSIVRKSYASSSSTTTPCSPRR